MYRKCDCRLGANNRIFLLIAFSGMRNIGLDSQRKRYSDLLHDFIVLSIKVKNFYIMLASDTRSLYYSHTEEENKMLKGKELVSEIPKIMFSHNMS